MAIGFSLFTSYFVQHQQHQNCYVYIIYLSDIGKFSLHRCYIIYLNSIWRFMENIYLEDV